MEKIKWGLMGAGQIVERWIKGARQSEDMEIAAVASRSSENAGKAAQKYDIPCAMTYRELAERPDIDVVYVPVPHNAHKELALLAMEHGKSVLVEKPAAVNAAEWRQMTECAQKSGVFLMEAMWTRFFPLVKTIKGLLNNDGIGAVRAVNVAFSFRALGHLNGPRLFDPNQAGGGLLDTGVYNLHFCDMIFDRPPMELTGFAAIDTDECHIKVDEQAMYLANYTGGALASMASGIRTDMIDTAFIYGTCGRIVLPSFWKPTHMTVTIGGTEKSYSVPVAQRVDGVEDEGFQYEIAHVNSCLREGLTESPVMTWRKTQQVLEQCDCLRSQWGLKYPFEK